MKYELDSNGRKRVTLIAGDGIGPEVALATRRIIVTAAVTASWRPVSSFQALNATDRGLERFFVRVRHRAAEAVA